MQLDPGPIPHIDAAGYDAPFDAPGLADYVGGVLQPLDGLEIALDVFLDPEAAILDDLADDGVGDLLDYSDAIFAQTVDTLGTVPVDSIDSAASLVDEETVNAFSIVPGEAFQDVPPVEAAPVDTGGGPPPVSVQPTDATISNLSRPGATDFALGDQYRIDVHIRPNVGGGGNYANIHVQANVFIDQTSEAGLDLGYTDANGFLSYTGSFTGDVAGDWELQLYGAAADGTQLNLTSLSFVVTQQTGTQQITVTFFVQQLGYPCEECVVHSGYDALLTVTGPPNAAVIITGTFNGVPFAPVTVGATDQTGTFQLGVHYDDSAIGEWYERYSVGGVDWGRQLHVTIIPAQ